MYDELVKRLREIPEEFGNARNFAVACQQAMYEAADAIEELSATISKMEIATRWIPVEELLPEEEESVFVVRKFLGIKGQVPPSTYTEIAYRIGDRWVADSDEYKIARHKHTDPLYWMPLPQPPKEES